MDTPNKHISNWINNNKDLLHAYLGKWIAYSENGIIASSNTLAETCSIADKIMDGYLVYFVNPDHFKVRFRPIHFRSISGTAS